MSQPAFVNDARVMAKGQVTIPKNVRAALGVDTGDRVTFIVYGTSFSRDFPTKTHNLTFPLLSGAVFSFHKFCP